ncbi:putative limonoid glucosyltransferase [Helianthus annuus]|uniref:Limonoid glucosyltransferase n=1 Tax=Helianthus annuus TaxID=4232 RepID=A0A251VES8_HELAN|nr:putative limonoid glucosyltransferase [Helianthus annuus]KAJ0618253.1 putative limonoid glucosyltransferase [Helianthus annuus]KAJ0776715.1 putative limonoid glucosyltransferase [Helianthus annuus]KAJ0804920.1 putative limonoid glucosyltransferase [Helianthus annuus]KAJ0951177.1 putative limonoid glucosyltransferase [Helianthus annuus]
MDRIGTRGKIVSWAPQQAVLAHPSIACFELYSRRLGFEKDENGVIGRDEIMGKIDQLINNREFKTRALDLKEKVINSIREDGSSCKNFKRFVKWMQEKDGYGENVTKIQLGL